MAATAEATDIGALQSQVDQARQQAGALAADLEAKQRQMVAAQQQAAAAAARARGHHIVSGALTPSSARPLAMTCPTALQSASRANIRRRSSWSTR